MPTLNIEGRRVTVADSFLKLSPEDQQATVDEIASHFTPDEPVTANNLARSFSTGVPLIGGLLNRADAATNATLAPVLNPLFETKDQLSEPTWSGRYAHALQDQNAMDERFAAAHPAVNTGTEIAGGTAAMVPAIAAAPGLFGVNGGLGNMMLRGGLSNAAIGATDAGIRGGSPVAGGIIGGALGAGIPVVGTVAKTVAAPIVSNLLARLNPERYATGQIARAIAESGRAPADIAADVTAAANEGQPVFTLADAMGNPGQRMLRAAASGPGEGRTAVANFLEGRQAGQGRRIANTLAEGFGTPQTAAQTERAMTAARDTAADAEYGAVRSDAGQVDVVPAINAIDRTIGTGRGQVLQAPNDSIEGVLLPFRERLARVNPDDFEAVQRIRNDMADAAQNARQNGFGNRSRLIGQAVRELDAGMETASPGYREANANFAQASRDIEAIQAGRSAAMRGRVEDTIPEFERLTPAGQNAYRAGYADPLIEAAQTAAPGANKARPLMNDAFQAEARAMAPQGPLQTFPIAETPQEAAFRQGYPHVVRLDASQVRNIAESQSQHPLLWNQAKANAIRQAGGAQGYPRLSVQRGRISVEDGGHRISVAAERGQGIEVAVRTPEEARTLQQLAGGNPERANRLSRKIAREQTMFETRNEALGGSKTDMNLADADALGIDPSVVGHIISGNYTGAAKALIAAGSNAVTGNTPQVRKAIADILLRRGVDVSPTALDEMVGETLRRLQRAQRLANQGGRAVAGGAAVGLQSRKKAKQ